MHCDIAIVGAGVAGLAAAGTLRRAGIDARCFEATHRAGGRILTIHDPHMPEAIELGAEFVHGRPRETWEIIQANGFPAFEQTAKAVHLQRGQVVTQRQVGEFGEGALDRAGKSSRRRDETFESFLRRSHQPEAAKEWARFHIEGFNAARADRISVNSLVQDSEAADEIEGERSFRLPGGYDAIPRALLRQTPEGERCLHLNAVVERIEWGRGRVNIFYRNALHRHRTVHCREAIITVPLGVLQASPQSVGAIEFAPEPPGILEAARTLEFGQVYRVAFRFQDAFWENDERLRGAGFLLARDKRFFAWWTQHPVMAPLLTGWMAGSAAERFHPDSRAAVTAEALGSLERILGCKIPQPQAAYFHDWRKDPFFRGAYSYVPVNGMAARETLAKPVAGTLFFAGEATETKGHGSTVHGAIASGVRAAQLAQHHLAALIKRKVA